jgi:hypothetical protein
MIIILMALIPIDIFLLHRQPAAEQSTATPVSINPIAQENQLPGTQSWQKTVDNPYDPKAFRSPLLEGYAWKASAIAGDTVSFSVSTTSPSFTAAIYRLGWYQGMGGRLLETIPNIAGHFYPMPIMDQQTGLIDAGWPAAFSIKIKPEWVSGMYIARFAIADGTEAYAPFVVRSTRPTTFVFIHGDTTDQAYNFWGGKSLYEYNSTDQHRAYKVSFNRPLGDQAGLGNLLYWEYPMIRWLEKNGYDVGYLASADVHTDANVLKNHRGIFVVGHSEYWSKEIMDHLEAAVDSGINLANFAADTAAWQIRFEPSTSTTHALPDRIIVCYKDKTLDPLTGKDNAHVTVQFRDPPVNRPEQALFGSMYVADFINTASVSMIVTDASSWVFAGTGLRNGDTLPGLLGYECDAVIDTYHAPAGLSVVSATPVYTSDRAHRICNATVYTAASGARVFNASTMRWSWGLDSFNMADSHQGIVNLSVQLITQNILQNFQT